MVFVFASDVCMLFRLGHRWCCGKYGVFGRPCCMFSWIFFSGYMALVPIVRQNPESNVKTAKLIAKESEEHLSCSYQSFSSECFVFNLDLIF